MKIKILIMKTEWPKLFQIKQKKITVGSKSNYLSIRMCLYTEWITTTENELILVGKILPIISKTKSYFYILIYLIKKVNEDTLKAYIL